MTLSLAPSWLPSLTQPADWLIANILGILVVIGLCALYAIPDKGGEKIV